MDFKRLVKTFSELGETLGKIGSGETFPDWSPAQKELAERYNSIQLYNQWFIPEFMSYAFRTWGDALRGEKVEKWLGKYSLLHSGIKDPATVGLVMAGNLPMVGLHDLLCVIVSGNRALVKLSSLDDRLIPAVTGVLFESDPSLRERVKFTRERLKEFDAIIATGSNNTFRYFEYYFRNVPSLIRRNRNGVAIIKGDEPEEWYRLLADDIFLYFGLGCRNISKLYLPVGFDPQRILQHFSTYSFLIHHNKYCNNYDYQKSLLMINRDTYSDNGYLLVKPSASIASPVAVVHYEYYDDVSLIPEIIESQAKDIQCVVENGRIIPGSVGAGESQMPELWDYADGVDTMQFLLGLE